MNPDDKAVDILFDVTGEQDMGYHFDLLLDFIDDNNLLAEFEKYLIKVQSEMP